MIKDWDQIMRIARTRARVFNERSRVEAMECSPRMERVTGQKYVYIVMRSARGIEGWR